MSNHKEPEIDGRKRVLITGGAGFIGSHLANELLSKGQEVRMLDNLSPQVHGPKRRRPEYLAPEAELVIGDVRRCRGVTPEPEGRRGGVPPGGDGGRGSEHV